jgi:uncharacterized membrane protein YhaH (DUF805 family)
MREFLARRMGRGPYWLLVLLNSVIALPLIWGIGFVMRHLMVDASGRPSLVSSLWLINPLFLQLLHLPSFIGTIWRLHDTGHRSWPVWLLAAYPICLMGLGYLALPIVRATPALQTAHISEEQVITALYGFYGFQLVLLGILVRTIYLCCLRGDFGSNYYGPPPGEPLTYPTEPTEVAAAPAEPRIALPAARAAAPQQRSFGRRAG